MIVDGERQHGNCSVLDKLQDEPILRRESQCPSLAAFPSHCSSVVLEWQCTFSVSGGGQCCIFC